MPIQYAPPEAFDAETFSRASRGDVERQNAELGIRAFGVGAAAQNDFFRTAIASGAQRAEAGNMQARLVQDAYQFDEAIKARERLAGMDIQGNLAAIQLRGRVQAELAQMDPGYAEQQEYDRNIAAISRLQVDPNLTDFERDQELAKIIPGTKLMKQRMMQSQMRLDEERAKKEFEQAERIAKITDMQGKFLSKSLPERTVPLPDGNGWLVETQAGRWEHIKPEPPPKPPSMAEMRGEADIAFPEDVVDPETGKSRRSAEQQFRYNDYLGKIWERERAKQQGGPGTVEAGGGAQVKLPVYDQKPFDNGQPTTDLQRNQIGAMETFRARAEKLPGDVKMMYKQKVAMLADIIRRGTPSAERELYDRLVNDLEQMPAPDAPKQPVGNPNRLPAGGGVPLSS